MIAALMPPIISHLCAAVVCAELSDPVNGHLELTGTQFGDTATYSCNSGFRLVGSEMRICLGDGRWSGSLPVCTRK